MKAKFQVYDMPIYNWREMDRGEIATIWSETFHSEKEMRTHMLSPIPKREMEEYLRYRSEYRDREPFWFIITNYRGYSSDPLQKKIAYGFKP